MPKLGGGQRVTTSTRTVPVVLGVAIVAAILIKYIVTDAFAWPDTLLLVVGCLLVVSPLLSGLRVKDWGELVFHTNSAPNGGSAAFDPKEDAESFSQDPELASAKEALAQDKPEKAIQILTELTRKNPKYSTELLTALTLSTNRRDWSRARKMLPKYGLAKHYHRLGYYLFQEANYSAAAELAKKGLELALASSDDSERELIPRIRNNLAFYYAMMGEEEYREAALHHAKEAHRQHVEEGANAELVASSLDTLGFTRITFASSKNGIEEGLRNLEEARRLGGRPDMYFRHVELAARRMSELAGQESTRESDT